MCDEGLEAVLKNGCKICPSLTFPFNNVDLSTPSDPAYDSFVAGHKREIESAVPVLTNAHKAGAEFLVGTDTGFAVTPYGEWHWRELEIFVKHLGFTPAEALKCATRNNSRFLKEKGATGTLTVGQLADFVVLKSDPLKDIRVLQDPDSIVAVYKNGKRISLDLPEEVKAVRGEKAMTYWSRVYARADAGPASSARTASAR
jgi:imidazolonepropionase-like amidohydrolase